MKRNIVFAPGEYYHVYNRGSDKRTIFQNEHDYKRFMVLLYACNGQAALNTRDHFHKGRSFVELFEFMRGERLVDVGAYCLMPNHFHILIRGKEDGGVSAFMKKLQTAYSMYFNNKHDRSGTLFEGRFKAQHVGSNDNYLKYLFSYIHLNPVKLIEPAWKDTGIADKERAQHYLEKYMYSSYVDYRGEQRPEGSILSPDSFPEYFSKGKDFADFTHDWLHYAPMQ